MTFNLKEVFCDCHTGGSHWAAVPADTADIVTEADVGHAIYGEILDRP